MRKALEYRSFAAAVLLSPWVYLILLLTMFFLGKDIGSTNQAASGLISIATGENGHVLTAMWFLSALSIISIPLLILWQEQSIAGFERSGFLPLLLSSSMSEQMYRRTRLLTGVFVATAIALLTAILGILILSGLELGNHPATFGFFSAAALIIYLPNLIVGVFFAAYLSHINDRSVALGAGVSAPLLVIFLFGLIPRSLESSNVVLWLLALEPTGTLYFSELGRVVSGAGWGRPGVAELLPLLLNRLVVVMLAIVFVARYLRGHSFFERTSPSSFLGRTRSSIRTSTATSTLLLALLAIWMTVSNIHSNFSKNLRFYQIDPDMSFLVAAALPDIQAYVIFALTLLTGKVVWENRETGFSTLELSSSLNGQRLLMRFLTQWCLLVTVFGLALIGATALMFGDHLAELDVVALLEYIAIYLIPGLLLISMIVIFISTISPNRIIGYFATLAMAIVYLVATTEAWIELPLTLFPSSFPDYSELSGRLVFSPGTFSNAAILLAVSAIFGGTCMLLLGKERAWSAGYLPKSTSAWCAALFAVAAVALAIFLPLMERERTRAPFLSPSLETAAQYEKAALELPVFDYDLASATIELSAEPGDQVRLRSTFRVSRPSQTGSPVPITWGLSPSREVVIRVDGAPVQFETPSPGLYLIDAPPAPSFDVSMEANLQLTERQQPLMLQSFHGSWPTLPVLGVLPELFVRSGTDRASLGLPAESAEITRFHPDGLSRPAVPVTLIARYPCTMTAALPWRGVETADGASCVQSVESDALARTELFVGLGAWSEETLTDDRGSLRILYPKRRRSEARSLLSSTAVAREIVLGRMSGATTLDLTLVTPPHSLLGGSNALSKPGIVFVSSTRILNSSLRGDELREREIGLMAHELMHQWYGHAVRPETGRPGAIFVNELPAEFARAFALTTLGSDAYERYMMSQMMRYQYVIRTQARPDGAALTSVESDEIYYRSSMLAHFLSSQLGWEGVMMRLADFASSSSYGPPVTSADLLNELTAGLSRDAALFARALVETDVVFHWDAEDERLTARCISTDCDDRRFLVPIIATNGQTEWHDPESIDLSSLRRSPVHHFTMDL